MTSKPIEEELKQTKTERFAQWLMDRAEKKEAKEIPWNFAKFLVSPDGKVFKYR